MRELSLNGYIDEESWFGDEITPDSLHELLYGKDNAATDDVHIRLNSYGGSCNAATRMFDDIRAYPGSVKITVSGTGGFRRDGPLHGGGPAGDDARQPVHDPRSQHGGLRK